MRIHRFFIKTPIGEDDHLVIKESALIHQWRDVFRYTTGARMVFFDGTGNEYLVLLERINPDRAEFAVLERKSGMAEEAKKTSKERQVWLGAALIKNDNFDWILQKATELGVSGIFPIIAERSIKKELNQERSLRIVQEASEQSGRLDIPQVEEPKKLIETLEYFEERFGGKGGGKVIVCQGGKDSMTWAKGGKKIMSGKGPLLFLVGPEGGWSPKEIEYFDKKKYVKVVIGKNVLRAETAAVSILALSQI